MGEYARLKDSGREIKIGTCKLMYYCRYDQVDQIDYKGLGYNLYWRIPDISEDGIAVGDYSYLDGSDSLSYHVGVNPEKLADVDKAAWARKSGISQCYIKPLGLLVNVACYHGFRKPQDSEDVSFHWNGKRSSIHLAYLKNTKEELMVVARCAGCGELAAFSFNEIQDAICSWQMKVRLFRQCTEYWYLHNDGERCPYELKLDAGNLVITSSRAGYECKLNGGATEFVGGWNAVIAVIAFAFRMKGNEVEQLKKL